MEHCKGLQIYRVNYRGVNIEEFNYRRVFICEGYRLRGWNITGSAMCKVEYRMG